MNVVFVLRIQGRGHNAVDTRQAEEIGTWEACKGYIARS